MSMNNEKKTKNALSSKLSGRKYRYGGYATILTVVVIAVVILLNVAIGAIETNWALSIDVTAMNATDFDEQTLEILKNLDSDVHIYTVYQTSTSTSARVQVDSVLEKYHALNSHITLGNVDPVKQPSLIQKYLTTAGLSENTSIKEGSVLVMNADENKIKVINRDDYSYYQTFAGNTYTFFVLENKVTSALAYVSSAETPRVFFLTGHGGELEGTQYFSILTQQLANRNYDVAALNLLETDVTLVPGDTLIIVDPARDLETSEYDTLFTWLQSGGRLLVSMSMTVDMSRLPKFAQLLDYYQISYGDGVIYENEASTGNYWNGGTNNLVPNMDADHDITADLASSGYTLVVPNARPINDVAMPESGLTFTKLLTTSNRAIVVNGNEESTPGTQTVALAMLKRDSSDSTKDVRIVVLGDYYLLADNALMYYSYNLNFAVNAVDWLVNSDSTVQVPVKYITNAALTIPDASTARTLAIVVIVGIPLVVIVCGVVVWIKRRRL